EDRAVAIVAQRRVDEGPRHDIMATRLEHQGMADPVEAGEEIEAPLAHGGALENGRAAGDEAHRIAAGVAVDALIRVIGHRAVSYLAPAAITALTWSMARRISVCTASGVLQAA